MRTVSERFTERALDDLRRALQDLTYVYEDERDLYSLLGTVSPKLGQLAAAAHEVERVIDVVEALAE